MKVLVARDVSVRFSLLGRLIGALQIFFLGRLTIDTLTVKLDVDQNDVERLLLEEPGRPIFGQTVDPEDPPKA